MTLLFLRHAIAEERLNGVDHADRRLTSKGIHQAKTMGAFVRKNRINVTSIYTSPYHRAIETTQHFSSQLPEEVATFVAPWLKIYTPNTDAITEILKIDQEGDHVVFVGHEPDFSLIIGSMIEAPSEAIKIRKASLTCLQRTNPSQKKYQLKWSITPDLVSTSML